MIPPTIQERAKKMGARAKVATMIVIGVIVAPFVGTAIYGLTGVIVAAFIATSALAVAPLIGQKLENWKLRQLKAEAARHPIETLQLEHQRGSINLQENLDAIGKLRTQISTFADRVEGFKREYPDEAPKYEKQLGEMQELLELHEQKYLESSKALDKFAAEIEKAEAVWDMSKASAEAAAGTQLQLDDFEAKIKTETALLAVQESMNQSFAQLATLRLQNRTARKLAPRDNKPL